MRKLRNAMVIVLILVGLGLVTLGILFKHYTSPIGDVSEKVTVSLKGTGEAIGKELEDNGLIRSATFFKIYLKLFNVGNLKAVGTGNAVITVVSTSNSEIKDTCEVVVGEKTVKVSKITLDKSNVGMKVSTVTKLTASVFPNNASPILLSLSPENL